MNSIKDISAPRKPSEFIKTRQNNSCRIYASPNSQSSIFELIRDSDISINQCQVPFEQSLFIPEPSNLVLEGFTPFKTYELVISFRNIDQVPRKIRLEPSNSPYFSIHGWKKKGLQSEKIASGMEIAFVVKFTPEENVDYIHNLVCVTEREKFIVPIKAIGARGQVELIRHFGFAR